MTNGSLVALVRRDWRWLAFAWLAAAVAFVTAAMQTWFVKIWVLPPHDGDVLFHTGWIVGAAIGLLGAHYDLFVGVREHVLQRPVAPARLAAARLTGMVVVLAAAALAAVVVPWAWEVAFGGFAAFGKPSHIGWFLAVLAPSASSCAIAYFGGTLPCSTLRQLAFAAALWFATFVLFDQLARGLSTAPATLGWLHAAAAVGFGWLAIGNAAQFADPDLAWPMAVRRRAAPALAVGIALAGSIGLGALGDDLIGRLASGSPVIGESAGRFVLARVEREPGADLFHYTWWLYDEQHRRLGEAKDVQMVWTRHELPRTGDPAVGWPRDPRMQLGSAFCVLYDGRLHIADGMYFGQAIAIELDRDGEPFSPDARLVRLDRADGEDVVAVLEPGSPAVWCYEGPGRRLVARPLPDGDRAVEVAFVQAATAGSSQQGGSGPDRYSVGALFDSRGARRCAVVGTRWRYLLQGDEFVALDPAQWTDSQAPEPPSLRVELADADLLAPQVRVTSAGGETFEHSFAPRTFAEHLFAVGALAASALRPWPIEALSFALPRPDRLASPLTDVLLRGQHRLSVLVACLLLTALASWRTQRYLRRLQAEPAVRRLWLVLTLLLGPLGQMTCWLVERPRGYAALPDEAAAPGPRIASPAA